ncbi:MAG: hypothetical protein Q8S53_06515 [Brevundimonas sp.]|uniref:hypothetical protein n=1 Tax=Brevundimonas sp. TaxID=1871086 RepID=UPI0027323DA5|nr:hypothetical protein [Brevundimonas sp.]MDP3378000.1 hypothetical protein [Brevundimonas sp.]
MKTITFGIALALLTGLMPGTAAAQQTPPLEETTVEDIVVLGMPLREQVETFVDDVTAPATGWGPARWDERWGICVGVVNLRRDAAQTMADRISEVALDLNLTVGEPGCSPNVLIIATDDAPALATAMVERSPNAFRPRYSGAARPASQLEIFQTRDSPVRWWHVSMPIIRDTGRPAVRLPGMGPPMINSWGSRLTTPITSRLLRAYVIIDIDQAEGLSFRQLADYVAMVTFAQIDPDAEISGFPTILNVFDNPNIAFGLTDWDQDYLEALYGSEMNQRHPSHQTGAVASLMFRERRQAEREADTDTLDAE